MALPAPKMDLRGGNLFEIIVSGLVIGVALAFFVFMYIRTGTGHLGNYALRVSLPDAAGLDIGSEVRLAGTKVGSVTALTINSADYKAIVEIRIRDDLSLPTDTRAMVSTSPLGNIFMSLNPGHATQSVPPGGELKMVVPRGRAGV